MIIALDTQQIRELVDEARWVMKVALMETSEESERLNRADEAKVNAQLLIGHRRTLPVLNCAKPNQMKR